MQRQLFGYKYDSSKSVIENCLQIQQYAEDLQAEGEDVKESWVHHHFRTAWDNVSAADKNLNKLFERLRLEEDRLQEDELHVSSSQNAFISRQGVRVEGRQFYARNGSPNFNSSVECFKCGQKGHIKRYCKNAPCQKYLE